jgi:long-chain acyl-CoA synthetase
MVHPIYKRTVLPLINLLVKKVEGMENIPDPPAILAANHSSYYDPFFIIEPVLKQKNHKVHFLANRGQMLKVFGKTISTKWAGCIILDDPKEAYNALLAQLKKRKFIAIFPEGGFPKDPSKQDGKVRTKGKSGAIRLSLETQAPIVPIAIKGAYDVAPQRKIIPKFKKQVRIKFGKPYVIKTDKVTKEFLKEKTTELLDKIRKLHDSI